MYQIGQHTVINESGMVSFSRLQQYWHLTKVNIVLANHKWHRIFCLNKGAECLSIKSIKAIGAFICFSVLWKPGLSSVTDVRLLVKHLIMHHAFKSLISLLQLMVAQAYMLQTSLVPIAVQAAGYKMLPDTNKFPPGNWG